MNKIFFTVGPSEVYPTVPHHIQKAVEDQVLSLSHRGDEFQKLYQSVEVSLKQLLTIPQDYAVFFLGSSIEAMERIIQNTVEKKSFHFVDGVFSQKAASIAEDLQKDVVKVAALESSDYSIGNVTVPSDAELIFITENDTSTGLLFPHEMIYTLRKKYPDTLIAVDLVSSAPYSSIDFSKIDLAFFSGQKGFGIPAGLSMLVVSPRAIEKATILKKKGIAIGTFHSFLSLAKSRVGWETPETPNVLAIYLLSKVLKDMVDKGISVIRQEIDEKASMLYSYFDLEKKFKPFVADPVFRSPSTLVIEVDGGSQKLIDSLVKKGMIVGNGYGSNSSKHIRIANFPAHTSVHVEKLIKTMQTLVKS